MAKCSFFSDFTNPTETKILLFIINDVISDKYKSQIENYRKVLKEKGKEAAKYLRQKLPAFTPSGTFKQNRKLQNLDDYNKIICLDFDDIEISSMSAIEQKLKTDRFVFAAFVSPSANGYKVFVEVDSDKEDHLIAYQQVSEYYHRLLHIKSDKSCKDITRLCFVSYDTNAIKNTNRDIFKVKTDKEKAKPLKPKPQQNKTTQDFSFTDEVLFKQCIQLTERNFQFVEGSRNSFVHSLACNCNRKGMDQQTCLSNIQINYNYDANEVLASVKSAYQNNATQFNTDKFIPNTKTNKNAKSEKVSFEALKSSPTLPKEIFDKLPKLIQDGILAFSKTREQDVSLTGTLAMLSGCLPNVLGVYANDIVYPNLFAFIIAPAASGKGVLKHSKQLGEVFQKKLLESNEIEIAKYKTELEQYKADIRTLKKGETLNQEEPEKPPFRIAFIPANCSYAKILNHLKQNDGKGIIFETEADSMGIVFKQDWGGYSDMLRKGFHHETISMSRQTNNEYVEIGEPKISIVLSGTPNQVANIISSAEDGLFSRFIYYVFNGTNAWDDVSPNNSKPIYKQHFNTLSIEVDKMIEFYNTTKMEVKLSDNQWNQLNQAGAKWLNEIVSFVSEDATSVAKRLGLILFRICMILTAVRNFDDANVTETIICNNQDFETALKLANIYFEHSLIMFNNLPAKDANVVFKGADNKRNFYEKLPNQFKRKDAIEIAKQFNISERNTANILKDLVNKKLLKQPSHGNYEKVTNNTS